MAGLVFEDQSPVAPIAPNRMDIALMVGFVRQRAGTPFPASVWQWLTEQGWTAPRYAGRLAGLIDLPVPVENWALFDQLFAWEQRSDSGSDGSTCFGAAVRSFFAQGGRRCYVVRVGDPLGLLALRASRRQSISLLLPGYPFHFDPSPADRESWHGVGHLFGLRDVSMICLPDLPEMVAMDRQRVPVPDPPPASPEVFVECSQQQPSPPAYQTVRDVGAPRCDDQGYSDWAAAVNIVTDTLRNRSREVAFVAAIPMPAQEMNLDGVRKTAFLQLSYPWVRTPGSETLPESLEPPDGAFAGILARNALTAGAYSSAAGLVPGDIYDLFPQLPRQEEDLLEDHVSLFAPVPDGLRLISDVTWSGDENYRPGCVSRLVAVIIRTARRFGEDLTFETNGEKTWAEVRSRLDYFMLGLYRDGALRGATAADAYYVRCDRSTMTQNDIDAGRLVAIIQFDPAAPIDTLTVVLALTDDRMAIAPMAGVA